MAKKTGLGRGLDALFTDNEVGSSSDLAILKISEIEINEDQPRKTFDRTALEELADSISQHGVIQPIVVRQLPNGYYQIIAGERRYRASKMAGLNEVPVIIRTLDDRTAAELSLVENLQREDLNPVDEANGYRYLMDEYYLTQEEISQRVGKSRSTIANSLRLLALPPSVLEHLEAGAITGGHARALLSLEDPALALTISHKIIRSDLSVRETEKIIRDYKNGKPAQSDMAESPVDVYFKSLENKVSGAVGKSIKINRNRRNKDKGKLEISYATAGELEDILRIILGEDALDEVFNELK